MSSRESSLSSITNILSVAFLSAIAFFILYIFRYVDDNRLTSWKWTVPEFKILFFVVVFIAGIVVVYTLSRIKFFNRKPAITLFCISYLLSMFFWSEPEVIVDASRYFTQAKHLEIYGIKYFLLSWGNVIHAWTDLPLVPFFYGIILKVSGESRFFIQVFTTALFSMTCVVTYFIGSHLWDRETGFYGGLLLLGMPYLFTQVPLMLVDVPTMFFLTLSIFAFLKALEMGRFYILLASLSIFFAVLSKYSTWLMLSVVVVAVIVYLITFSIDRRIVLQRAGATAYITGVLITVFIFFKFDVFSSQVAFLREYQLPGLRRWSESYISTFFYQIHPFITIAAIFSLYRAIRKRDIRYIVICWLIVLVIILQIQRARYLLIVFPMLTLMASYGLNVFRSIELKKYIVFGVVVYSFSLGVFAYLPFLKSISMVNIKDSAMHINSLDKKYVEVITLPVEDTFVNPAVAVPIFDLFTDKKIFYQYDTRFIPPFEEIRESSMRFTWEYRNPEYYCAKRNMPLNDTVVVVISNGKLKTMPMEIKERLQGYRLTESFEKTSDIYRYAPYVSLFVPDVL
jgi:hypothetical protein